MRWSRKVRVVRKATCPVCGELAVAYVFYGVPHAYLRCMNINCASYCGTQTFHRIVEEDIAKEGAAADD